MAKKTEDGGLHFDNWDLNYLAPAVNIALAQLRTADPGDEVAACVREGLEQISVQISEQLYTHLAAEFPPESEQDRAVLKQICGVKNR